MKKYKKILIVSATIEEVQPFLNKCKILNKKTNLFECSCANIKIDFLITGLGIAFTIFHLTKQLLSLDYDLVINAGIAGNFKENIRIGDVVNVKSDCFADLGIEYPEGFNTIFEEKLVDENIFPFKNGILFNNSLESELSYKDVKEVNAITVNMVHGNVNSINYIINKFNPDIETMEGAAFFYVCENFEKNYIQIRSISNKVEVRNKNNWNITLAIKNLNEFLSDFIKNISD